MWFTHILRWYLYKVKCVIFITPSLFILKVVCCSTFPDWCKSLGDVISSMIMLGFSAETRSVVICSDVFCNYYLFFSAHEIHHSRTEICWVCVIFAYGPLFFLLYTVYTHIRHNLSQLYILSNIRTILYITSSILVYYLVPHSLQKFPCWRITNGNKLKKAFKKNSRFLWAWKCLTTKSVLLSFTCLFQDSNKRRFKQSFL